MMSAKKNPIRSVNSKIYSRDYYLNDCLGSEEFKYSPGSVFHPRVKLLLSNLKFQRGMKVLDVGCGRGDVVFFCAKKGMEAVGIDYSKDGILLAKYAQGKQKKEIKKITKFYKMDAKKLDFKDNSFDFVISIDVFEHLYPEELEIAVSEISRVLKPGGKLLVHTEANRLYLDVAHPFYAYPVSNFLLFLNKTFFHSNYESISKDPRNDLHKKQHVNEPTYFYLFGLFRRHRFKGRIMQSIGMLKPHLGWKDILYNVLVFLYPISLFPPLIYFFAYNYVCVMRNDKYQ